jgi:hypothetical protein
MRHVCIPVTAAPARIARWRGGQGKVGKVGARKGIFA